MATFHCSKWPGCDCPDGSVRHYCPGLYDKRNAIVLEGEGLRRERLAADRPFFSTPGESLLIILAILIAIGAAFYAANEALGVAV